MRRQTRWAVAASTAIGIAALLLILRIAPHAPLAARIPLASAVVDRNDRLLRVALASDGQLRLWTPLDAMPRQLVDSVLLYEDRHFTWHPGVNPVALLRATLATAGGSRQGASTITMQLARLLDRRNTRSVGGKLQQIGAALWLEARYSKREILEAYLNLAPYGGNVQGVGAAAQLYFGKRVDQLDLAEAQALAVLPQSPNARAPKGLESASLRAARLRLLDRWLVEHPADQRLAGFVRKPLRFERDDLPFEAPHLTTALLRQPGAADASGRIHSTLDLRLQKLVERVVHEHLTGSSREGINNAAALLLDVRDMGVRAWIGSADFDNAAIEGQVDGVSARRSPGSTLKPLLYALAIDQGLIHPRTILKDTPSWFGPYAPENADGGFLGPVTAHDALIRSRNIPAVQIAARLADPSFYQWLKSAGVRLTMSERHYGLALTLGGGEVSMLELAQLYATLANRGLWHPAATLLDRQSPQSAGGGRRLLSEESSFMVLDILRDNPRPDDALFRPARGRLTPAWKTGTSWGFRDAWTAGVVGPYVLVVWLGNFDGRSNPALVGIHAAAPLFLKLADALAAADPQLRDLAVRNPPRLARVEVCAASGDLPNADCPQRATTWFIPGVSPIRLSDVHRRLRIDRRSGRLACADTPAAFVREEVFEIWPSEFMRLFAQAGMPRRAPPAAGDCTEGSTAPMQAPRITSPIAGVDYVLRAEELGIKALPLIAHADGEVDKLYWFADGNYLGSCAPGASLPYSPRRAGTVTLSVSTESGAQQTRELRVRLE